VAARLGGFGMYGGRGRGDVAQSVLPVERRETPSQLPPDLVSRAALADRGRSARFAEAEWGPLFRTLRGELLLRTLAAIPMALTATALVLVFQIMQHTPVGSVLVERLGAVRASQPLWIDLLRTPISLFVPAPDLPVWGAAAQVLLVFGMAEIALGRRRTLVIGLAGTLAGTLYARHGVEVGPGHLFGLPQLDAYVRDSGPSAAVVALAVVIAWEYRAWVTGGLVIAFMLMEEALLPNLAGAEHLVAILTAAAIAALTPRLRNHALDETPTPELAPTKDSIHAAA
jgi:hypothetical protein